MKKETTLDVLKDIRALLQAQVPSAPKIQKGEYRTVNISKGMTIEGMLAECKKLFPVWRYTENNLDEYVTSDRTSDKAYSIKFKNVQEADEDMKKLSANEIKEKGLQTITLLERLVMELDYFEETGKHLDIENWTLCAGSRYSDGDVPYVGWSSGKLSVGWTSVDNRFSSLRARVALTL